MANRRMFSLDIVSSDAFLDMPASTQVLYFHLGMYADDDGFVNPRKIMRMVNASEDDLKLLIAKRFLLVFENGVIVIKHWKINNYIQNDRYKPTRYLEEKNKLTLKENGSYTDCIQGVSKVETQVRLGKVSIGKNRERGPEASLSYLEKIPENDVKEFISKFHITDKELHKKGSELTNYCRMHGKQYKNYKAFLIQVLLRDYKKREVLNGQAISDLVPG